MPYLHCPTCRLSTYSAAAYASHDECPRCGTTLAAAPRTLFARDGQARDRATAPGVRNAGRAAWQQDAHADLGA